MHYTQTAPHDPYRKLATAIIAQAVRDYTAPYPIDTGHKSVDSRRKQWKVNHVSAEWFLFRECKTMGPWQMCCMLMRIDPALARKDMVKKLKNNANVLDISSDK